MRDQPAGDNLLETARAVVLDTLLPALPADRQHDARMVANAIAIALRQWRRGSAPEREALGALEALLGTPPTPTTADDATVGRRLADAERHCCEALRSGELGATAQVWSTLQRLVRHKVEESNPKYLDSRPTR